MSVWGALAGGAVGGVVLTVGYELFQVAGLTRIDLPLILGTAFTEDRDRARAIGYAVHLANGLLFALVYAAVFAATGRAGWLFGLVLGAVHAGFVGGSLMNVILPAVHPRMGKPWTDASAIPLLEPPGFMLRNYGGSTMAVTLALHLAYGAIVGAFAAGL
ncbi:MAG TPA: hypothetical protein VGM80_17340 [Gaiellaceae bacterium]